jgi:hypothetical protein
MKFIFVLLFCVLFVCMVSSSPASPVSQSTLEPELLHDEYTEWDIVRPFTTKITLDRPELTEFMECVFCTSNQRIWLPKYNICLHKVEAHNHLHNDYTPTRHTMYHCFMHYILMKMGREEEDQWHRKFYLF